MKTTDEKNEMEQTFTADKTHEISQESLPSTQSLDRFCSGLSAQSGANVVAPSIIGSNVTTLNINITSAGQDSTNSSKDVVNCDAADNYESLQQQYNKITECQQKLKVTLRRKFSHLSEEMPQLKKIHLDKIYTELYITEGGCAEVNKEHEVRQIETSSRIPVTQEKSIPCNQLFVPLPGEDLHIRTVITRGVAGIGKTVSVNKFTLDWAEERTNTNLEFVFPLCFRELNLMRKKTCSLEDLLYIFFPETKDTGIFTNDKTKMLFILDGLDESRLALDFHKSEIISDVKQPAKISVIVTNLIRGRLLPLSLIWITSRPVASCQIPVEHVDMVTEVRGFNNLQKDEYFRKKISDQILANKVIEHVKSYRSLHIMCHIPVFCRVAAGVLEKKMVSTESQDTSKTLTEMYIHFLYLYMENMKKRLVGRRESNTDQIRADLISLGKLAFKELVKGHSIFYESDLILNGINIKQASMFSGVYTQIFNEELILCNEKMFCFVHLSVQEFFASLYVFLMFHNNDDNVLVEKSSVLSQDELSGDTEELVLYKEAVEKSLQYENGHFDIFLRFLLGLSLESNQCLLKHLMRNNRSNEKTRAEIIKYIKEKITSSSLSLDRRRNLEYCLIELNDHFLMEEIQSYLSRSISFPAFCLFPLFLVPFPFFFPCHVFVLWFVCLFVCLRREERRKLITHPV